MFAELITIGDELLIGQVVDTNSAWMGRELKSFASYRFAIEKKRSWKRLIMR